MSHTNQWLVLVPSVKNLIFDLGGVILDLSVDHTLQSFAKLSDLPKEKVQDLYVTTPGFLEYEKGLIDDRTFRDFVRQTFSIEADDAAIDECWNAMLRGIPNLKLELLLRLQNEFRVFLLSNTNAIHLDYINRQMLPVDGSDNSLDRYFHRPTPPRPSLS